MIETSSRQITEWQGNKGHRLYCSLRLVEVCGYHSPSKSCNCPKHGRPNSRGQCMKVAYGNLALTLHPSSFPGTDVHSKPCRICQCGLFLETSEPEVKDNGRKQFISKQRMNWRTGQQNQKPRLWETQLAASFLLGPHLRRCVWRHRARLRRAAAKVASAAQPDQDIGSTTRQLALDKTGDIKAASMDSTISMPSGQQELTSTWPYLSSQPAAAYFCSVVLVQTISSNSLLLRHTQHARNCCFCMILLWSLQVHCLFKVCICQHLLALYQFFY